MFSVSLKRKLVAACVFTVLAVSAGPAFADGRWAETHPRRDQVNDRLANQNRRLHEEVREGEMNRGRAAQLHREDRFIRREERFFASRDGGHITAGEQRLLNRQENFVSHQIGR